MSVFLALYACRTASTVPPVEDPSWHDHGPIAEGIYATLGEPVPYATPDQLATFARGKEFAIRRFDRADGLGPAFNVTFCAACHEKPVVGGGAGLYRNFFLAGHQTVDGVFLFDESAGNPSGVVRMYAYGDEASRPDVPDTATIVAQRNPIAFFGVGLLAEIEADEILSREDPDDTDGDGVSGHANWDRGFVGRFGMKSQTVSIEGFIRGPLMNHLGVTSNPLTDEQRALLPIDSSGSEPDQSTTALRHWMQAAAPDGPLVDDDGVTDPELSGDDLFDVVSMSMLMAPPEPEPFDEVHLAGRRAFDAAGCDRCHTPRMQSPRGPLPLYSDLLVHDMGPDLADGIVMKEASGSEFRSAPLWGVIATPPYLHDGRAATLDDAIRLHGGEAEGARDRYEAMTDAQRESILGFLGSLGGASQVSSGLIPPGTPVAPVGTLGGPDHALDAEEAAQFLAGRDQFDREFAESDGVGGPRFNGDSCRACHFEPVVGGAGPRDVNVMRHGIVGADGRFVVPSVGTILHKQTALRGNPVRAQPEASIFEHRQTPHLFGLGAIEAIPDDVILANADPDDLDGDGITGQPSWTDGGRLGRFGWKAQVPTIDEFVRDAVGAELGMTLPYQDGLTFGALFDNDDVPDPEYTLDDAAKLAFYLRTLAGPARIPSDDPAVDDGAEVFEAVGCARCHLPSLDGVPLYSDLLLHAVLAPDAVGVEDASAEMTEFRTAPLWGLSQTAPYLHSGEADTLDQAIRQHDGEAAEIRDRYRELSDLDRDALLAFLGTL
ncbi:MAG: di-heme oxidoredictase family protein [Myxococcota bacterium]